MNKLCQGILLAFMCFMVAPMSAATLTVVYPKMQAPRDITFNQIINGIQKEFKGTVKLVAVDRKLDKKNAKQLAIDTESQKPDMVIALGRSGRKIGRNFSANIPWVSGALPIRPSSKSNKASGITPVIDPSVMFNNLKNLAPKVKRIYVVYSKSSRWLVKRAEKSAVDHGFEIQVFAVKDRAQALVKYNELIKNTLGKNDAVWLPYDKYSADSKYVLPMILEAAWENRFVVFSSRPEFVKRGVLFSMMPDNEVTGMELVKMVKQMHKNAQKAGVKTTIVANLAVNLRTASHLGFEYTTKQKGQFLLTFPTQ